MQLPQVNINVQDVLSLLSGGGLVGFLMYLTTRKKNKADMNLANVTAETQMANSALSYAMMMRNEVDALKRDIKATSDRAQRLDAHIKVLEDHVRLQITFIDKLKTALQEYNPKHPLLNEKMPPVPQRS